VSRNKGPLEPPGFQIYVVDDDRDTADGLVASLVTMGHRAVAYYDGSSVLDASGRSKPDCVLLDVSMDGLDGLEVTKAMRAAFGDDVILIAITGVAKDDKTVQETFRIVDHYFVKPLDMQRLEQILRICLSLRENEGRDRRRR